VGCQVAFGAMEQLGATHEDEKENNERDKQVRSSHCFGRLVHLFSKYSSRIVRYILFTTIVVRFWSKSP